VVNIVEVVVRTVNDTKAGLESAKSDFSKAGRDISNSLKPVGIAMAGSGLLSMAAPLGAAGLAVGAFGAVAAPTLKKVEAALTSTGKAGKKAWADLDPAQKNLATSIKGLESSFDAVAKSLEPMVTGVLHLGVTLAHDLLPSLSTLGSAGGAALKSVLTPLDQLVKSSGFTTFIKQMADFAKQAAPVIGTLLVGALKIFMQLMEQLAPIGLQLLKSLTPLFLGVMKSAVPVIKTLAQVLADVLAPLSKYSGVVGPLVVGLYGLVKVVQLARGVFLALTAAMELNPVILITTAIVALGAAVYIAWQKSSVFRDIIKDIAKVMLNVGIVVIRANQAIVNAFLALASTVIHAAATAFGWIPGLGPKLRGAATQFDNFKAGVNNSFNSMIDKMHGWNNELDASKNKANTATQIISGDFGKQLLATNASTKGVNTLAQAIGNLHGKTVTVGANATASGNISIVGSGWAAGSGNIRFHAAQGAYINSGSGPTADDNLARVSRGELIVPAHMVSAGSVNHLRGKIPGFAAGGIVGMPQAAAGFTGNDAKEAVTTGITNAMIAAKAKVAVAAAEAVAASAVAGIGGLVGSGVSRWAPQIKQALSMLGQPASDLGAVEHRMGVESGGNPTIVNKWDSNWQAGHPSVGLMQVIRGTFQAYAGQFRNTGPFEYGVSVNPLANIYAGLNYAIHAYRGRSLASVMMQAGGYDSGGWLPTGASIAVNNTGRPERVMGPHDQMNVNLIIEGGESKFEQFMLQFIREHVRVKGGGNVQRAFGRGN